MLDKCNTCGRPPSEVGRLRRKYEKINICSKCNKVLI